MIYYTCYKPVVPPAPKDAWYLLEILTNTDDKFVTVRNYNFKLNKFQDSLERLNTINYKFNDIISSKRNAIRVLKRYKQIRKGSLKERCDLSTKHFYIQSQELLFVES